MGIAKLRTKERFQDKIMTQTPSSQTGFRVAIDNFETFSKIKIDFVPYRKIHLLVLVHVKL